MMIYKIVSIISRLATYNSHCFLSHIFVPNKAMLNVLRLKSRLNKISVGVIPSGYVVPNVSVDKGSYVEASLLLSPYLPSTNSISVDVAGEWLQSECSNHCRYPISSGIHVDIPIPCEYASRYESHSHPRSMRCSTGVDEEPPLIIN